MTRALRVVLMAAGLLLSATRGASALGWLVDVPNFEGLDPAHLPGYLARPSGPGRFPGVVILHGCNGFTSSQAETADRLRIWGYVALAIDSLSPRGMSTACSTGLAQVFDAQAALHYLSRQEFVDPSRVAVLGYSMGGGAALRLAQNDGVRSEFEERFRAAIAYYPGCDAESAPMAIPTMVLIGAADDWTPAEACRVLQERMRHAATPIDLTVYPGVYHAFTASQAKPGFRNDLGHWIEYDEFAAKDAEAKTRAFLAAHLAALPAAKPRP
jgi:dienelactone hydrolase